MHINKHRETMLTMMYIWNAPYILLTHNMYNILYIKLKLILYLKIYRQLMNTLLLQYFFCMFKRESGEIGGRLHNGLIVSDFRCRLWARSDFAVRVNGLMCFTAGCWPVSVEINYCEDGQTFPKISFTFHCLAYYVFFSPNNCGIERRCKYIIYIS